MHLHSFFWLYYTSEVLTQDKYNLNIQTINLFSAKCQRGRGRIFLLKLFFRWKSAASLVTSCISYSHVLYIKKKKFLHIFSNKVSRVNTISKVNIWKIFFYSLHPKEEDWYIRYQGTSNQNSQNHYSDINRSIQQRNRPELSDLTQL